MSLSLFKKIFVCVTTLHLVIWIRRQVQSVVLGFSSGICVFHGIYFVKWRIVFNLVENI